jgi:hypothetical protein
MLLKTSVISQLIYHSKVVAVRLLGITLYFVADALHTTCTTCVVTERYDMRATITQGWTRSRVQSQHAIDLENNTRTGFLHINSQAATFKITFNSSLTLGKKIAWNNVRTPNMLHLRLGPSFELLYVNMLFHSHTFWKSNSSCYIIIIVIITLLRNREWSGITDICFVRKEQCNIKYTRHCTMQQTCR